MITSILTFFAVGTIGFWLLLTLTSIVFIGFIENDNYWFPSLLAIGLGIAYWKPFINAVDWRTIVIGFIAYAFIGMAWSAWRWFKYVKQKVEEHIENDKEYGRISTREGFECEFEIKLSYNKFRIIGWISYWPWSLFWNLTQDFFTAAFDAMKGIYEKITKIVIDKAVANLPVFVSKPVVSKPMKTEPEFKTEYPTMDKIK